MNLNSLGSDDDIAATLEKLEKIIDQDDTELRMTGEETLDPDIDEKTLLKSMREIAKEVADAGNNDDLFKNLDGFSEIHENDPLDNLDPKLALKLNQLTSHNRINSVIFENELRLNQTTRLNQTITPRDFKNSVWQRLNDYESDRQNKLIAMQIEKRRNEIMECTSRPTLNEQSKDIIKKKNIGPLRERLNGWLTDREDKLTQKRHAQFEKKKYLEEKELTFAPNLIKKADNRTLDEFLLSVEQWDSMKKKNREDGKREKDEAEVEGVTFQPQVKTKTKYLSKGKDKELWKLPMEQRAAILAERKEKKIKALRQDTNPSFKPKINKKSAQMKSDGRLGLDRLYNSSRYSPQRRMKTLGGGTGGGTAAATMTSKNILNLTSSSRGSSGMPFSTTGSKKIHSRQISDIPHIDESISEHDPAISSSKDEDEGRGEVSRVDPLGVDEGGQSDDSAAYDDDDGDSVASYRVNGCVGPGCGQSDESQSIKSMTYTPEIAKLLSKIG